MMPEGTFIKRGDDAYRHSPVRNGRCLQTFSGKGDSFQVQSRGENNQGPVSQAPRNFRGQKIENEKLLDISKPGPPDFDAGP